MRTRVHYIIAAWLLLTANIQALTQCGIQGSTACPVKRFYIEDETGGQATSRQIELLRQLIKSNQLDGLNVDSSMLFDYQEVGPDEKAEVIVDLVTDVDEPVSHFVNGPQIVLYPFSKLNSMPLMDLVPAEPAHVRA